MNLKNIFKKRPSKYQLLKDEIKSLEDRVFNKKRDDTSTFPNLYRYLYGGGFHKPITLEEEISILQDKLDLIAKHLGLVFAKTEKKDEEWAVKKLKTKK